MNELAWLGVFTFLAVAAICATATLLYERRIAHERWLREFEASQKPQLELAKLEARLNETDKALRSLQLAKALR